MKHTPVSPSVSFQLKHGDTSSTIYPDSPQSLTLPHLQTHSQYIPRLSSMNGSKVRVWVGRSHVVFIRVIDSAHRYIWVSYGTVWIVINEDLQACDLLAGRCGSH